MTMNSVLGRAGAVAAALVLASGLAACGNGERMDDSQQPTGGTAHPSEESADQDSPTDEDTTDSDEDTAGPDEDTGPVQVDPTGEGPMGLRTADTPDGESEQVSGKLIVGPGSCFSLKERGQPELLVFDEGADFVLREGRPSVTTDELGTVNVGEPVDLQAVSVDQADLNGIPDRCAQGASDTVLVATD